VALRKTNLPEISKIDGQVGGRLWRCTVDHIVAYGPFLLKGILVTITLSICSVIVAVSLGLAGALASKSKSALAKKTAFGYTTIVRGIPDLVVMLLLYNGGQMALNYFGSVTGLWSYVELNRFVAGVTAIGFVYGAYMSETFRGAYMAIPVGMIEAGVSFGMSRSVLFRRIIWPHLVRLALPGFTNNWLTLMKSTALVSVIGLEDIVYNGFAAGRATREPFTFMLVALAVYLILTVISDVGLRVLERRNNRGVVRGIWR
jgi:histidine transport system permease protein/arginine/ornithine transport system permease protein